jgi:hypothetical protein
VGKARKRRDSSSGCVLSRGSRTTRVDSRCVTVPQVRGARAIGRDPLFGGPNSCDPAGRIGLPDEISSDARDAQFHPSGSHRIRRSGSPCTSLQCLARAPFGSPRVAGRRRAARPPSSPASCFCPGHAFTVTPLVTRARTRRSPLVRFGSPATFAGRAVLVRGCQPRTIPFRRSSPTGHAPTSSQPVRAVALAVFLLAPSRRSFPSRFVLTGTSSASPRGSFVHGFFDYICACAVTDPPPGIFAAWPSCATLVPWRRRSATFLGFDSGSWPFAALLRSAGVSTLSSVTRPRAVEPRATRDYFDVRHRRRGPVLAMGFPSPRRARAGHAPASGFLPRRTAVPLNWCGPA